MSFFILLLFAVLPSFLWVVYYFRKDDHPEPKRMILYVFLAGAFTALLGYLFQKSSVTILQPFVTTNFPELASYFIIFRKVFLVAFSEEFFKYLAFFFTVRHHQELDEPVDIVIYMITAALGFAALENFLLLSSLPTSNLENIIAVSALRFLTATLLHALASGLLGVFLVYGYRSSKRIMLFWGLLVATIAHAVYNFLIMRINLYPVEVNIFGGLHYADTQPLITIYPFLFLSISFLIFLAVVLSVMIERTKRLEPVCVFCEKE